MRKIRQRDRTLEIFGFILALGAKINPKIGSAALAARIFWNLFPAPPKKRAPKKRREQTAHQATTNLRKSTDLQKSRPI